ncbi:Zn-ribbon domain-containing protein [Archaeoglobus neptunius]|uniref:Zn-ribbon domain-containing protein n=1 Tax=Archaeoglobus neptunius TaxID=2798580 RepID=UPI00192517C8|nr:Zn-ribbon domain-containing protein [Archaeoglobus neptunius]
MPHRCTKCGKLYPSGDMRILNGCECGNNKFLYVPEKREVEPVEVEQEITRELTEMGIETVRIISPGRYEINIERLLQGEGIVIALQEDGRYIIHLPSLLKKRGQKKFK